MDVHTGRLSRGSVRIGALVRPVTEDTTADAREVGKVPTRGVLLDVSHHVFG